MQNNFLTTIRSLRFIEGCKSATAHLYPLNSDPSSSSSSSNPSSSASNLNDTRHTFSLRSRSSHRHHSHSHSHSLILDTFLPYGLPSIDQIDPPIDPFLRPIDQISAFASSFRALHDADPEKDNLCDLYLEQRSLFHSLNDPKLMRRCLRDARIHAPDVHHKVVLSAWLRFERREDELAPNSGTSLNCCLESNPALECPKAALQYGYSPHTPFDPCPCRNVQPSPASSSRDVKFDDGEEEGDVWFCIGDEEVACIRHKIAALSQPLKTLLYGGFSESRRERINFTQNGISVKGMRAVDVFSRTKSLSDFTPETVLELLGFANKFCCDGLKAKCDSKLAGLIRSVDDALLLVEYGLYETSHLLVAACLQAFLREPLKSLNDPEIVKVLCTPEGKAGLEACGHASFALYYFLSQVAMEDDTRSNTTVALLERLGECALPGWQKQLALHQLGCVMLERGEYKDAQKLFEEAVAEGHVYSLIGVARAKYKKGHKYSAYKLINSLLNEHSPAGWMYQERSLYNSGKEKMMDLSTATELDATLSYPYKYRAVAFSEEDQMGAAINEINKILGFKVSTDCLDLRAWFSLVAQNYEGALRDIRAIMTLDPGYMIFHGKVHGDQMIEVLKQHVQQWDMADCWMQLYDRWSAVDDIGSLAVVHQMLAKEPGNSSLRFRQSLLLLRLNCQKAAMHSLRLARNNSQHEHERLVYEGWILYDTGHRKEALSKAEKSIALQRSFEAFFLKAYALADGNLDQSSSSFVIQLLEQANSCASDNLRKGQAHNNMGSVYVDCEMLDEAAECYTKALGIKHTRAHQGLARVYFLRNQKKAAYDEMTKLIEKAKNNASAYEKRSEYCERDLAQSDLNLATKLDPLRTYPYRYRAAILMDDHKEDEAISELSKAIAFKPDLQLLHLRAAFYDSMGKYENTLRDCEAALYLDPNHGDTVELYNRARNRSAEQKNDTPMHPNVGTQDNH